MIDINEDKIMVQMIKVGQVNETSKLKEIKLNL